jgi:hypothetical protein
MKILRSSLRDYPGLMTITNCGTDHSQRQEVTLPGEHQPPA